jgi:hypothetical protein
MIINYFDIEDNQLNENFDGISGWLATDSGLYYSENSYSNIIERNSIRGQVFYYVKIDEKDSNIVYFFNDSGFFRSTNKCITYKKINSIITNNFEEVFDIFYFKKNNINNFILSTKDGLFLLIDSIKSVFEIKIETDGTFKDLDLKNIKIGTLINNDINSIKIFFEDYASEDSEYSSLDFSSESYDKILFNLDYLNNNTEKNTFIGKLSLNPKGKVFEINNPEQSIDIISYGIKNGTDKFFIPSNKGLFFSENLKNWNNLDSIFSSKNIYDVAQTKESTLIATSSGLLQANNKDFSEVKTKSNSDKKIKAIWNYNFGEKESLYYAGDFGLIINYKNYDKFKVITSESSKEEIFISWGDYERNLVCGLEEALIKEINTKRVFTDFCQRNPVDVDALGLTGYLIVRSENPDEDFIPENQVSYEERDRRFIDSIRRNRFDISEVIDEPEYLTFSFPDGLVIVDNIKRPVTEAIKRSDTPVIGSDTFNEDFFYTDDTSITVEEDLTSSFGSLDSENGALISSNKSYYYSIFPYYERPPNFVFESSGAGCSWIRVYYKAKIKNYSTFIPIENLPGSSLITCGTSFDEFSYCLGTDNGVFFSNENQGLKKSSGTDGIYINIIKKLKNNYEESNYYGYGYGYGYGYDYFSTDLDFFNVFSVSGSLNGYCLDQNISYGFSYGYEKVNYTNIIAASNSGLYLSINNGESFTKIFDSSDFNIKEIFSIEQDLEYNIYIGTDKGIFIKKHLESNWEFYGFPGNSDFIKEENCMGTYIN